MRERPAEALHGKSIEELVSLGDDDRHALSTVGPHVIRDNSATSATAAGRQPTRCLNVNMRKQSAEVLHGESIEELVSLGDDDRHALLTVCPHVIRDNCVTSATAAVR